MNIKSAIAGGLLALCSLAVQAQGWYLGASVGLMDADRSGFDDATNAGLLAGYDVFTGEVYAFSLEAEVTTTVSDGDVENGGTDGDWDIDTQAVYAAARVGKDIYVKARFGVAWTDTSVDIAGNSFDDSDSSVSWGASLGWMFSEHLGVQVDGTQVESDVDYWNLGLKYRF